MAKERIVMCMKWGGLYPASYVNVLYSAVKKNLSEPFRFICLTNEPEELDEGIESFPIPELGLPPERYNHGAWPKIAVFKKDLYGLSGRCLFIDLDTIIWGNLDPFFKMEGDFFAICCNRTWKARRKSWPHRTWKKLLEAKKRVQKKTISPQAASLMGTGIFCFDLGCQSQIYDTFVKDKSAAFNTFGNEQQLVEHYVTSWKPWDFEWVISFKLQLRRPVFIDLILPPKKPAPHIPVIAFHGNPRPIDLVHSNRSSMKEFPHFWRGPVKWVRSYWVENGYQID